ncbi:hypothetical protein V8D89_013832 [Ganoderma adspersum]
MTPDRPRSPVNYRKACNVDPCSSANNIDNGCQVVFPRMEPGGRLCPLCAKLQDAATTAAEAEMIRADCTQCNECGICGTTVTDPCGTCCRADNYERGILDHEQENSAQCRRANLEINFSNRTDNPVVGTANSLTELQAVQAVQGFGAASKRAHCTAVYFGCRRSDAPKQINQMLGTGVIFFPEVNTMLALRSRIVKEVNGRWTEFYSAPLLEEETSLHAPNNYVFPADNFVMTVAQWYQEYSCPEYRDTYIVLSKQTQRKGKQNSKSYAFSVELYIHIGQYAAHTGDPEIIGAGRAGGKRKSSIVELRVGSLSSKRTRDIVPSQLLIRQTLRSLFVADSNLLTQTPSAISVTKIQFKKTICLISEGSGSPTLMEESTVLSGLLETRTLDLSSGERGNMKDVFGLRIGTESFVAKKLVNIGGGRSEELPLSKTISVLTADLIRIKRMAYFADKFKTVANNQGMHITEFDVSEAFLIKSYKSSLPVVPPTESADGDHDEGNADVDSAEEVSAVYLVEPLRLTMTVVKFSGTLGSTTRTDLRSLTVSAFAHYVTEETACRSNNGNTNRKLSLMLFDPMTHTFEGTSGIGDHGPKGIQDFISSHTCNHICLGLRLASLDLLQNTLDRSSEVEGGGTTGDGQENPSNEE